MPEPNILILGAGFSGFTLARGLRRDAAAHRLRLTVVEPEPRPWRGTRWCRSGAR